IKPHYFVLVPAVLLAHRKRHLFLGAVLGIMALLGASFAVHPHWVADWIAMISNPAITPQVQGMMGLGGFNLAPGVLLALRAGLAVLVTALAWRSKFYPAVAVAILGAELMVPHTYGGSAVLLLPLLLRLPWGIQAYIGLQLLWVLWPESLTGLVLFV